MRFTLQAVILSVCYINYVFSQDIMGKSTCNKEQVSRYNGECFTHWKYELENQMWRKCETLKEALQEEIRRVNDNIKVLSIRLNSQSDLQKEIRRLNDKIKVLSVCLNSQSEDCRFNDLDWVRFKDNFYYISKMSLSWYDASQFCSGIDAHLADVSTAEENDFLSQIVQKADTSNEDCFWLDGSDELNHGQWIWSSVGEPITFNKWGEGQPNNNLGNEHCLEILDKEHRLWNDRRCYNLRRFICEKKSGKWIQFQSSTYFISNFIADWNEASNICKEIGAHLAVVSSPEENNFLIMEAERGDDSLSGNPSRFWLDGSDKLKEGEWKWNSTSEPFNFTNWDNGEPNNAKGGEDCLTMANSALLWNDDKCNKVYRFICEKIK